VCRQHSMASMTDFCTLLLKGRNWICGRRSVEEVVPGLWIGDISSRSVYNSFDCVIDCTAGCQSKRGDGGDRPTCHIVLSLSDVTSPDFRQYIDKQRAMLNAILLVTPIIDTHLCSGKRVLVHCRAGKQRSATIIAAYLMLYREVPIDRAISRLRQIPGCFTPYCNFELALRQSNWHQLIHKK